MTGDAWIALAILVGAGLFFVLKWASPEIVALSIPVALVATGVLDDPILALSGFGNEAVIALGSIFVVGAGLHASGVADIMARGILRASGRDEARVLVFLMASAALVSGFMNNAAVVALFLPATVAIARRTLIAPSRLLMPMAFAAVLGGNLTLLGTAPNLLVSEYLRARVGEGLGVFDFARVGVPIVIAGIVFTATIGRRLLPQRSSEQRLREAMLPEDLAQSYGLTKNLCQMTVLSRSTLVGRTIAQAAIRARYHLSVLTVVRPGSIAPRYLDPKPGLVLEANDQLYIEGDDEDAWRFAEQETLQFALAGPQAIESILGRGQTLAEVSVAPRSNAVGRSFRQLGFGARYSLNVLSLWRRGAPQSDHANAPLVFGDAFLVSGPSVKVAELSRDPDYIVLTDHAAAVDFRRAPLALLLLAVAVVPPALGWAPLAIAALAAALLMVITGCVSLDGARRSLEWKAIFLIAGTMPLATAMEQTGVATAISSSILSTTAPFGAAGAVASLFLLAAIVSITSSNGTAALVVAPIAGQAAAAGAIDLPRALLAVAYGSSCAFVLPMAQWNLLVMGPGGYRTRDFVRFGSAMSLVVIATVVVMLAAR